MIIDNDLLSMQQARILAENACAAQKALALFPQERLDEIVERVALAVTPHLGELAKLSSTETDGGVWRDKLVKNGFVCTAVLERLRSVRCVGVIAEDRASGLMDVGVPLGVIAAACPSTSPVSTTIYLTLIAIKSGNAIVFSPHPRAEACMKRVLDIMIPAAREAGLPEGCLAYLDTVTRSGSLELMGHPSVSLLLVSGVPGLLEAARSTGKPVIFGGTGNGPAFIERTADIGRAVRDILDSKTFDNGMAPSAEQSIVVDGCVEREVVRALEENGAYFMTEAQSLALAGQFFCPLGKRRKGTMGVSASVLAGRAGFTVPDGTRVLVARRKYVSGNDPYSRELLAPVLALYVEDDWMHACEKCIELLLHEKNAHTLSIHSRDEEVIRQFALKKPVGRLLVNTPAAFGGMGATTNLFPSMTLGSGSAGRGITADNVSPMNLVYVRKVGRGVRESGSLLGSARPADVGTVERDDNEFGGSGQLHVLERILKEAIKTIR